MIPKDKIEEWRALLTTREIEKDDPEWQSDGAPWAYDLAAAVPALLSEREEMLALLRGLEWVGPDTQGGWSCPSCTADASVRWVPERQDSEVIPGTHAPDCRLAAFLREG
jgi:hypothetical protein